MRVKFLVGFVAAVILVMGGIYATTSPRSQHTQHDVAATSGAITGMVADTAGRPVKGAKVYADRNDTPMGRRQPYVLTDEHGMFVINDLAPGTYMVSTSKEEDGYGPTDTPFYAGEVQAPQVTINKGQNISNVVVPLGPQGVKLTGHVVDAMTKTRIKDLRDVQITIRRVDNPDHAFSLAPDLSGTFSILVPTIPVTVEVTAAGYQRWQHRLEGANNSKGNSKVVPGQVQKLVVTLRPNR